MNGLEGLLYGLSLAITPGLLLAAFAGALAGTLIGVLPGLGPVAGAALILPITFAYEPAVGLIMIAGIYLGAPYGGSTTSVLLNIPGDESAIVATFDGHEMTKKGRAGAALSIMAVGSFVAGTVGLVLLVTMAPLLSDVALNFGPAEFFALTAGGLIALARIAGGSLGSGLFPMVIGLVLGTVGREEAASYNRFTFGLLDLSLGLSLVSVAVGLYGLSELMFMLEDRERNRKPMHIRLRELLPTREEWRRAWAPWGRGSVIGFVFGLLPVPSATLSTFTSYRVEKAVSKNRREIGTGAVEGIAGPEAANNSAAIGSLVPVLVLGLPFSATLSLMISAMVVQGIQPGPLLITQNPEIFWSVVAAMYVANLMLLVLNLPMIGMWVQLLKLPYNILFPLIILFTIIGVYCSSNNVFDVYVMIAFGIIGYFMRKLGYEPAPLVLAFVLGPMLENNLRKSLILSQGDLMTFIERPISAVCLAFAVMLLVGPLLPSLRKKRELVALDEGV
jgi:putative tricarboxylic transport membrane protein